MSNEKQEKEPPVTMGKVTEENPSGIEKVSKETAIQFGELRDTGGPGAGGATVAGALGHHITEGGTKPIPTKEGEGEGETKEELAKEKEWEKAGNE